MVLRIDEIGVSVYEETGEAAPLAAEPPKDAFFTSASVIWPPEPVPLTLEILTPLSAASRIADALALGARSKAGCNLPPPPDCVSSSGAGFDSSFGGGAVLDPVSGGSDDSLASSFGGGGGGAFSPPASSSVNDSKAEASPSSIMTAIG